MLTINGKNTYKQINKFAESFEPSFDTGYKRWQKVNTVDFDIACNFINYMWNKNAKYKMPKRIEFKKTTGHRYNSWKRRSRTYKNVDGFYKIKQGTYLINVERGWSHFAHEFSHNLTWIMINNAEHSDYQAKVELEVHKELHTFLHKANNNLIDIVSFNKPKKVKKRKKRTIKKLPYQASYPTLRKRFPEINCEDEGIWDDQDGRRVWFVTIDNGFFTDHGLDSEHDCPLSEEGHYAWGADERYWKVETLAKFIYLIREGKNSPRDIVDNELA